MRLRSKARRGTALALFAGFAGACDGGSAPPTPASVTATTATTMTATVGTLASHAPGVRVVDSKGRGMSGVPVTFAITAGGGTLGSTTASTDREGAALAGPWRLGTTAGPNIVTATVAGIAPVTFTATGTAAAPASIAKVSGETQSAAVGTALPQPFVIRVVDVHGNPVPGVTVSFAATTQGATVSPASAATDADGRAGTTLTLGPTPGVNTVSATAGALPPQTFTATARPGPAAQIRKAGGDGQQGRAGSAVAVAPAVSVTDAFGNAVAGATVTFEVASGGGSVTLPTATTSASGIATVGSWVLGALGTNTLTATVQGVGSVTFTAMATGSPAAITKVAGDNQQGPSGSPVAVPPSVRVADASGNPVPNVTVTFAVASGGGSVTSGSATTGTSGIAAVGSWVLGAVGTNTLTATVQGVGSVTFTATATAAGPDPCTTAATFTLRTTLSGALSTADCRLPDGEYVDFYRTRFSTQQAEEITLTSTTFDTFLYLVGPGDQVLAADDNGMPGGTNASLRVYAPAGDYLVVASSANPGATGAYQLSSRAITARTGCVDQGWIVPGVSLTGSLATGDCTAGDGSRYDLYPVVLRAGQRLTVTMRSTAFDSYLLLLSSDGRLVASNDDGAGGDDSLITYTAPAGGVYLIIANSFSASGAGTYTLTVTSP